jgi:Zn-dependent peptidase ImmA (M78 family)
MRLVEVLLATRSVTEAYKSLNPVLTPPIRILDNGKKGIKNIIEEQTSQRINLTCLSWPGHMFAARLDRYQEVSYIRYSDTLNTCWSRFYIAKELTHILCGDEKNHTKDVLSLTDAIINGIELTGDMKDCMLEFQAFYGAIELLLPSFFYDELYQDEKNGKTCREIADKFRIPEKVIAFRLSESKKSLFDDFKNGVP